MSLPVDVRNEVKKLTDRKAFYAVAGAGDLAVETLRTLPERLTRLQDKADLTELSGRAVAYLIEQASRAVLAYDDLAERGMHVVDRVNKVTPQQAAAQLEQAARSTAEVTVRTANRTADAARTTAQTTARAASQAATQAAGQAALQVGQVAGRASQMAGRASDAGDSATSASEHGNGTAHSVSHPTRNSNGASRNSASTRNSTNPGRTTKKRSA
jgi:hypothetical protein